MPPANPPIALVTAGSAGLGAAVALLFARTGMRVVINYHGDSQRANDLVRQLQAASPLSLRPGRTDFHAIKADLSLRPEIQRLVGETVAIMCPPPSGVAEGYATMTDQQQQQKQHLDVVFSNGGWTQMRDLMDLDDNLVDEDWDKCFTMNVKSHLWLMHAARPYLEASYDSDSNGNGAASFITTASLAGVQPSGSSLAYSVTKAAQLHLARALAKIAAPKVRVNSVSPGLLMTVRFFLFVFWNAVVGWFNLLAYVACICVSGMGLEV
ncbi:hypothetical protein BD289DRAFT_424144 [Coniella lustricola]|uniref:Uncharacterized protein n=1 Tax=Coniella lustricola TaxID=2025994 RepID=A0A2T3AIR2_9PEZI|nr:hypothetical protein BD289DRAFT_424144 [Coniella lustricola]